MAAAMNPADSEHCRIVLNSVPSLECSRVLTKTHFRPKTISPGHIIFTPGSMLPIFFFVKADSLEQAQDALVVLITTTFSSVIRRLAMVMSWSTISDFEDLDALRQTIYDFWAQCHDYAVPSTDYEDMTRLFIGWCFDQARQYQGQEHRPCIWVADDDADEDACSCRV